MKMSDCTEQIGEEILCTSARHVQKYDGNGNGDRLLTTGRLLALVCFSAESRGLRDATE